MDINLIEAVIRCEWPEFICVSRLFIFLITITKTTSNLFFYPCQRCMFPLNLSVCHPQYYFHCSTKQIHAHAILPLVLMTSECVLMPVSAQGCLHVYVKTSLEKNTLHTFGSVFFPCVPTTSQSWYTPAYWWAKVAFFFTYVMSKHKCSVCSSQ